MKTELTPLQQLQLKIYTTLPDLKELGVGCEIIGWKSRAKYIVLSKINDETYRCLNNKNEIDIIIISQCEILGKPITLTDVLRWLKDLNQNEAYAIEADGCLLVNRGAEWTALTYLNSKNNHEVLFWNLSENLLENQPQAVIDFLNNL